MRVAFDAGGPLTCHFKERRDAAMCCLLVRDQAAFYERGRFVGSLLTGDKSTTLPLALVRPGTEFWPVLTEPGRSKYRTPASCE